MLTVLGQVQGWQDVRAAEQPTAAAISVAPFADDLYQALAHGGEIHIVKIISQVPSTQPASSASITLGIVTLSVVDTLSGPKRNTITLPFAYRIGRYMPGNMPVWIYADLLPNQSLLMVFIPGAVDPMYGPNPVGDGAACHVGVLSTPNPPGLTIYREIAHLRQVTDTASLLSALKTTARSQNLLLREYAIEALSGDIGPKNGQGAATALADLLRDGAKLHFTDATYILVLNQFGAIDASNAVGRPDAGRVSEGALADFIDSDTPSSDLKRHAIDVLAAILKSESETSAAVLTSAGARRLQASMDALFPGGRAENPAEAKVNGWLNNK